MRPVDAYRQAGYQGKACRHIHALIRLPEVQAERARVVEAAEVEARRRAALTRAEALEIAARVARGETPAETLSHSGQSPTGPTSWTRTRVSPLDGVRAAADLEGWAPQAGAGQVQVQIVLGGPPPVPGGPIVRGDGVVLGGDAAEVVLPAAAHVDTTPVVDGQIVLSVAHNPVAERPVSPQPTAVE